MEIPVQRHPFVNLLAKITMGARLGGASLLTAAVAGGMDQEPTPPTVSKLKAEDSGQTCPGTKQGDAAGESNPPPQEGRQKHSLYHSWRRMTEQADAGQPDWLSPLATTSGRIKDEFRYDMWRQSTPTGSTISTFGGGGKGLEFIAAPDVLSFSAVHRSHWKDVISGFYQSEK